MKKLTHFYFLLDGVLLPVPRLYPSYGTFTIILVDAFIPVTIVFFGRRGWVISGSAQVYSSLCVHQSIWQCLGTIWNAENQTQVAT